MANNWIAPRSIFHVIWIAMEKNISKMEPSTTVVFYIAQQCQGQEAG